MEDAPGQVTELLLDWTGGDAEALERLMPLVYEELRKLANHYFRRERPGNTLQATALVNEVYLKMVDQHRVRWQNRAHFFGVSAQIMRRILVDQARSRGAQKRGGDVQRMTLAPGVAIAEQPAVDLIDLDEALDELGAIDAQQAKVVELRFFAGLTVPETAEALGISPATVKREWSVAKAWLFRRLFPPAPEDEAG